MSPAVSSSPESVRLVSASSLGSPSWRRVSNSGLWSTENFLWLAIEDDQCGDMEERGVL